MYARECPGCKSKWPYDPKDFGVCPQCDVKTRVVAGRAMTGQQARFRVRAIEFEREYQERERDREARGEPSPEDLGRLDAARDLAEIRALESCFSNRGVPSIAERDENRNVG